MKNLNAEMKYCKSIISKNIYTEIFTLFDMKDYRQIVRLKRNVSINMDRDLLAHNNLKIFI